MNLIFKCLIFMGPKSSQKTFSANKWHNIKINMIFSIDTLKHNLPTITFLRRPTCFSSTSAIYFAPDGTWCIRPHHVCTSGFSNMWGFLWEWVYSSAHRQTLTWRTMCFGFYPVTCLGGLSRSQYSN